MTEHKTKKGSRKRQKLIKDQLLKVGTNEEISNAFGITEVRVRNWIYEGRIPRSAIPVLIKICAKKQIMLPFLLLVRPRKRIVPWSKNRKMIEEIFIILGGHKNISINMDVTRNAVKHWGRYARIGKNHVYPFLRFCSRQYIKYTGLRLDRMIYFFDEKTDNINIKRIHEAFKNAGFMNRIY